MVPDFNGLTLSLIVLGIAAAYGIFHFGSQILHLFGVL